jgi:hypothetical protein
MAWVFVKQKKFKQRAGGKVNFDGLCLELL